jgi:hypothetical protein
VVYHTRFWILYLIYMFMNMQTNTNRQDKKIRSMSNIMCHIVTTNNLYSSIKSWSITCNPIVANVSPKKIRWKSGAHPKIKKSGYSSGGLVRLDRHWSVFFFCSKQIIISFEQLHTILMVIISIIKTLLKIDVKSDILFFCIIKFLLLLL